MAANLGSLAGLTDQLTAHETGPTIPNAQRCLEKTVTSPTAPLRELVANEHCKTVWRKARWDLRG